MKFIMKTNCLVFLFLFFIVVVTMATSCSRRNMYKDPLVTTEQHETMIESFPEEDESNASPLGTGCPYQDMDRDALKDLYFESPMTSLPFGSVYNTPYYYIFSHSRHAYGGVAYSKLTGKMILLCKEMVCDHTECLFSRRINRCIVTEDGLYLLFDGSGNDGIAQLYFFDHLLNDQKLIWEGESIFDCVLHGECFYMLGSVWNEETKKSDNTIYMLNTKEGTLKPAFREYFPYQVARILDGTLYYVPEDGSVWRMDLETEEKHLVVDGSFLERENGDARFNPMGIIGGRLLICWVQNILGDERVLYFDLNDGNFVQDGLSDGQILMEWMQTEQYFSHDHTADDYRDDPNYTYYQDTYFGHRGGEIWRKDSISGDISLVARLSTDGIPDVVCTICATDGKTLVVSYKTYKDFDNVHNGYAQSGHDSAEEDGDRYAVIDLQTGVVYKNEYYEP